MAQGVSGRADGNATLRAAAGGARPKTSSGSRQTKKGKSIVSIPKQKKANRSVVGQLMFSKVKQAQAKPCLGEVLSEKEKERIKEEAVRREKELKLEDAMIGGLKEKQILVKPSPNCSPQLSLYYSVADQLSDCDMAQLVCEVKTYWDGNKDIKSFQEKEYYNQISSYMDDVCAGDFNKRFPSEHLQFLSDACYLTIDFYSISNADAVIYKPDMLPEAEAVPEKVILFLGAKETWRCCREKTDKSVEYVHHKIQLGKLLNELEDLDSDGKEEAGQKILTRYIAVACNKALEKGFFDNLDRQEIINLLQLFRDKLDEGLREGQKERRTKGTYSIDLYVIRIPRVLNSFMDGFYDEPDRDISNHVIAAVTSSVKYLNSLGGKQFSCSSKIAGFLGCADILSVRDLLVALLDFSVAVIDDKTIFDSVKAVVSKVHIFLIGKISQREVYGRDENFECLQELCEAVLLYTGERPDLCKLFGDDNVKASYKSIAKKIKKLKRESSRASAVFDDSEKGLRQGEVEYNRGESQGQDGVENRIRESLAAFLYPMFQDAKEKNFDYEEVDDGLELFTVADRNKRHEENKRSFFALVTIVKVTLAKYKFYTLVERIEAVGAQFVAAKEDFQTAVDNPRGYWVKTSAEQVAVLCNRLLEYSSNLHDVKGRILPKLNQSINEMEVYRAWLEAKGKMFGRGLTGDIDRMRGMVCRLNDIGDTLRKLNSLAQGTLTVRLKWLRNIADRMSDGSSQKGVHGIRSDRKILKTKEIMVRLQTSLCIVDSDSQEATKLLEKVDAMKSRRNNDS